MSATIVGSQVVLTGDGLGWSGGRVPFGTPPANSDGMVFTYRAWFDTYTGSYEDTGVMGWDNTWALGLTFGSTMPTEGHRENFFGMASYHAGTTSTLHNLFNANGFGSGKPSNHLGNNGGLSYLYNGTPSNTLLVEDWRVGLPANPTFGATFTGVFTAKKQSTGSVLLRYGYNLETLAHGDFSNAYSSANTAWVIADTSISDSTNWRPGGAMAFPTHFCAAFPSPTVGRKMVIDHARIDYWKYSS